MELEPKEAVPEQNPETNIFPKLSVLIKCPSSFKFPPALFAQSQFPSESIFAINISLRAPSLVRANEPK